MKNAAKKSVIERHENGKPNTPGAAVARSAQSVPAPLKLAQLSFMPGTILQRLALSESGFVFDPVSGQSFTVNETGLAVLRLAQGENDVAQLVSKLAGQFDAPEAEIKRDALDFADRMKGFFK